MARWMLCVVVLACAACGGSSPTAPVLPPPSATLTTVESKLELPDWPCENDGGCRYQFRFRNEGPDCVRAVHGTIRFARRAGF